VSDGFGTGGRCPRTIAFGTLAQRVLSLDSAIEWVALEEPGRRPRWAWRDPRSGGLYGGTISCDRQVVDPLLLMLADQPGVETGGETIENPHRVRFIVLAYADMMQVVARVQPSAHVVVALSPGTNPYALGTKLVNLLDHSARREFFH
jgi:hypothetical protein